MQDGPSAPKFKLQKGCGSKNGKPTCGKKHYGKCLLVLRISLVVLRMEIK